MRAHGAQETGGHLDLSSLSVKQLLTLYGRILNELLGRAVIRTRNAPAGDYAEYLVARALSGRLEPNSNRSWDVTGSDGEKIQVKCRVVGADTRRSAKYSAFRSFDFDTCIFVDLDRDSYEVVRAVAVPVEAVEARARRSNHVAGWFVSIGVDLVALEGAVDLTASVLAAGD